MKFELINKSNQKYLKGIAGQKLIENEQDVVDLIGICGENDTNKVLLYIENLPENFLDLKSQIAGMILQKFMNYSIKVALLLSENYIKGRFQELVNEVNQGKHFGVFQELEKAEKWLLNI